MNTSASDGMKGGSKVNIKCGLLIDRNGRQTCMRKT